MLLQLYVYLEELKQQPAATRETASLILRAVLNHYYYFYTHPPGKEPIDAGEKGEKKDKHKNTSDLSTHSVNEV